MELGHFTFQNGKTYVYVPTKKGPVFLRNILFLTRQHDPHTIVVVHSWGENHKSTWEPPKGQMEAKEASAVKKVHPKQLYAMMREGVLRELEEEAKILRDEIQDLRPLSLVYTEAWNQDEIKNAHFQYQFWTAHTTNKVVQKAKQRMETLLKHPDWVDILPPDMTEKDDIQWWSPKDGWDCIRGAFSKKMTKMYYSEPGGLA